MIRLSRERARQIAVRAQLLDVRSSDLLPVVERLTHLQVDPTNAVAPSADLVLWSRMGQAYWQGAADDALADRMLFQLIGTLRSTSHLPLYLEEMAAWPPEPGHGQRWLEANDAFRATSSPCWNARARCSRARSRTPRRCRGSRAAGPAPATSR